MPTPLPAFPSIPTDNLYKFIAIFGLFILIVSSIVWIGYNYELNNKRFEQVNEYEKVKDFLIARKVAEMGYWDAINRANKLQVNMFFNQPGDSIVDSTWAIKPNMETGKIDTVFEYLTVGMLYSNYRSEVKFYDSILGGYHPYQRNYKTMDSLPNSDSLKYKRAEFNLSQTNKILSSVNWLCGTGIFLGIILIISGFYFWYQKFQKYADYIIAKEAADKGYSSIEKKQEGESVD
jgi:hypothetical protein